MFSLLKSIKAYSEVRLKVNHLIANKFGLEHGNSGLLERMRGTTVQVRTTRTNTIVLLVVVVHSQVKSPKAVSCDLTKVQELGADSRINVF